MVIHQLRDLMIPKTGAGYKDYLQFVAEFLANIYNIKRIIMRFCNSGEAGIHIRHLWLTFSNTCASQHQRSPLRLRRSCLFIQVCAKSLPVLRRILSCFIDDKAE